ncbi:lipase family protein [Nocardia sp. NPDC057668]|uniref:lipase family protein n=1 Tax=Nocardia sp. NPDC057668 TaxID=3346202 RepID=UPI0036717BE4
MIPARLNPTSAGPIRRWCAALLVTLTAVTAAVAATGTAAAERVPTPEHDSFYDAPPNPGSLANGTVLIGALGGTSGTYSAGLGLLALSALDRIVPEANIPALLNDRGRTALAQNTRACGHDFGGKYAFSHLDDYAASPGLATHPRITALANRFRLDGNVPGAPSFVWHSTGDDALPIAATDAAVAAWCGAGATVSYRRTSTPTHLVSALSGVADALHFLDDRFAGVPAPAGCS